MNIKEINLNNLELKTFTEQDAEDYCQINNININNIVFLDLRYNELIDISGIKLFKNLQYIYMHNNKITDISVLKDLTRLEILDIGNNKITDISDVKKLNSLYLLYIDNLKLKSDQIEYINSLNNLKELWCRKGFKDMRILKQLNKNIKLYK